MSAQGKRCLYLHVLTPDGDFYITNMVAPRNNWFTLKGKVTFKWKKVTGANGYTVKVSEDPGDFSIPVFTASTATGLKKTSPALPHGVYYWRVETTGVVHTMPIWTFTVGP